MNKLWTFGCSMTAGAELGSKIHVAEFLKKRTGCITVDDAKRKLGANYQRTIVPEWNKFLYTLDTYQEDPFLTYAGVISKKLNLKLESCAISGSGIDQAFFKIIENSKNIDWKKDLVILGVTTAGRWIPQSLSSGKHFSLSQLDINQHRKLDPYLPCIESMDMFHYGALTLIKKMFPAINIVRMYDNQNTALINGIRIDPDDIYIGPKDLSLDGCCSGIANNQYPGGHPIEEMHEKFAEQLLPYFYKINKRRLKA
jgi:hypothetical protein